MTIRARPTPIHQPVDSFAALQAWIDKRLESIESDLADDETAQSNGRALRERLATLMDVAFVIRDAVESEASDAAADREYDRWKDAYRDLDPVDDALELRRLSGDR